MDAALQARLEDRPAPWRRRRLDKVSSPRLEALRVGAGGAHENGLLGPAAGAADAAQLEDAESNLPERYFYEPEDKRRDIQEGWKVVLKYNCTGCHVLRIGQRSVFVSPSP